MSPNVQFQIDFYPIIHFLKLKFLFVLLKQMLGQFPRESRLLKAQFSTKHKIYVCIFFLLPPPKKSYVAMVTMKQSMNLLNVMAYKYLNIKQVFNGVNVK